MDNLTSSPEINAHDARFQKMADELAWFVNDRGRMPMRVQDDADERRLGIWLTNQRIAHRKNPDSPKQKARFAQLTAAAGDWMNPERPDWNLKLDAVAAFLDEHGRLPRAAAADHTEKLLGMWVALQRRSAKEDGIGAGRLAMLDEAIPGWSTTAHDKTFEQTVEKLRAWRAAGNDRIPSPRSGSDEERSLGWWLHKQRSAVIHGQRTAERIGMIDAVIPGWSDTIDRD
ncbi:helicase associated domain-containing protein [Leifsonia sp. Leaf264]|uniref:helicase associated domain-containing protein n=1 Tax=Leifsonia sp. Leaf264 TaxID=1736314 RepID=UPI0007003506|nr:helicase associated domain-containing protein [Leifsonia sp. Leaf264]KQO98497.1 hypothetical protein ASF30_10570 [Leifsonia sp. Leaf264]